ncbi:MAG: methyltransferase domain-containing protein [Hyphomonadaceae bacterium]|nr:methyltransferase domain-containing protein [Hyphomonadaceae bacterium]
MAVAPFDPRRVRLHRERAAASGRDAWFLHDRIADDLAERLEAVNRTFAHVLVLGGGPAFAKALQLRPHARARIAGAVVTADWAGAEVLCDPERLPFREEAFDLVVSILALHWVNDLPGALIQIRRSLKPDGLFLGAQLGGRTLHELRGVLLAAEAEIRGGAALRIAPFADALDMAGLLQRAGFALPVADRDTATVRYRDPLRLLADLRAMGETSALAERAPPLTRATLFRAMALYRERFSAEDGRVPATFEVLTATGWSPHESQQKPLRPGAARMRLADALGVQEHSAGEKPG